MWLYFVLLFLIGAGLMMIIGELLATPFLRKIFYDIPYALPSWNRISRLTLALLFIGFFAGTISWYCEKRSSGR
jgi:hypothetical protein